MRNISTWQVRDLVWREAHLVVKVPWMSPRPGEDGTRSKLNLPSVIFLSLIYLHTPTYTHNTRMFRQEDTSKIYNLQLWGHNVKNVGFLFLSLFSSLSFFKNMIYKTHYCYKVNFISFQHAVCLSSS